MSDKAAERYVDLYVLMGAVEDALLHFTAGQPFMAELHAKKSGLPLRHWLLSQFASWALPPAPGPLLNTATDEGE